MKRFLEENETIILFSQGLVFFSLGFAVWLQRRRATRLRLTQSLIWLAAFAFVEALAVWGYVFVPIQEGYLRAGFVDVLLVVRAVLQTGAFLFLLQFGLRLVVDSSRWRNVWTALSGVGWALILVVAGILAGNGGWSTGQWERSVEALSRHSILLPAAVLSAAGLWKQREALADAGLRGIRPYAAAAAGVLLLYGVVSGIVVDHPFWDPGPATSDIDRFGAGTIQIAMVRGAAGLALCVLAVKLLEIFEFEAKQQLEALDRARTVAEERERFGRDLHDGTIQSLYAAGLQLESLAMVLRDERKRGQARQAVNGLNRTIVEIRDYITGLRQPGGGPAIMGLALEELTRRFAKDTGVDARFRIRGVATSGPLPEGAEQHLEHVLRESLSNAVRHGRARRVDVTVVFSPDELDLTVEDDGCGIADPPERVGEGLRNIRERARRMGGRAEIGPAPGGGTSVALAIPLDIEAPEESMTQPEEILQ